MKVNAMRQFLAKTHKIKRKRVIRSTFLAGLERLKGTPRGPVKAKGDLGFVIPTRDYGGSTVYGKYEKR